MTTPTETVPHVRVQTHIAICPHCQKELRVAPKYVAHEVTCRFCNGRLRVEADGPTTAQPAYRVIAVALDSSLTAEGSVPHWPTEAERLLNEQARQGYRLVRTFAAGEHLGVVFEKGSGPEPAE